ncbi:MAG: MFS transporter [Neisseriaceae bacterium]|nr:MFS transporter [Neisseriaceae bacterium]
MSNTHTTLEDVPLNSFHKKLALYSSGGPFLDGYVLSIIGIALVQATPTLQLSAFWQGLIAASALIGIFIGGFLGGWFTDKYGRKVLYALDLLAIIGCSVAQFWVESAWSLFVWRLLIGIAVGADYPIATSLLAEFVPKKSRGPLVGGLIMMWFVGAAVAYIVGELLLSTGPDGWRWMLASAAVPGVIFLAMRHGTPESPRWLLNKGRTEEAQQVIQKVYGPEYGIKDLPEEEVTQSIPISQLFHSGYGKRMWFITIFWTCSIVPLFAVYAFAPKILEALKLQGSLENFGSAAITVLFLVGCLVALRLVNPMGRRRLLIHSFLWSGVALLLLGMFPDGSSTVTFVLFSAYALFIGGTQILQFIYPNELFPTEIRATAVGLASSLSRIGAAIGTYLVPMSLASLGIGGTMYVAAAITLIGCFASWKMAPETKALGLGAAARLNP